MKNNVLGVLSRQKILPLITKVDRNTAETIIEAAQLAGITAIEYAARSEDAAPVFEAIVKLVRDKKYNILIGVGSILHVDDARKYHDLGADFIVSPHIDEEVAAYCKEKQVFWIPGAATLNEIVRANKLGAGIVKIFPADLLGGPAFIKAIAAPFPGLKLMPSGGVTTEKDNLKAWFDAGVVCVGIGSNLFSKSLMDDLSVDRVKQRFTTLQQLIQELN